MVTRRTIVKGLAAAPLVLPFAAQLRPTAAQEISVRVGSKDFPESITIGEMQALLLENAGLKVERKLNLGGTVVAHEALVNDELDVYPEYTGTGLLVVLKKTVADAIGGATPVAGDATPTTDPSVDAVYQYVKREYEAQYGLTWLDQTQMNDSQALAVKRDFATEKGISTISQLAELSQSEEITISAPSDFEEREDGLLGLQSVYNLSASVTGVAPGIKYQSFLDGDANVVLAFSTDAEIAINDLVVLQDDQALWPPYYVAPVVRMAALESAPQIADALNPLAPVLTTEKMVELNRQVIQDQQEPADVAKAFLQAEGLIPA
ncbi:MAG: quaternary ammonium transporter [Thermomicrobiales bacterium]|nr:quaternary ammonium transporter [Thermomicrobiales bacterium]